MNKYIVKSEKIVTVSSNGTLLNAAMVVEDGKIKDIDFWNNIRDKYSEYEVFDFGSLVITPSLIDCHTHLLEFATSLLYPNTTENTHLMAGKAILLHALSCGITALGEQVCGHPSCNLTISDYKESVDNLPMDIVFAATSISIGLPDLVHFTSVTGSTPVSRDDLLDKDILNKIIDNNEYPGENIFLNATPANFKEEDVPRSGEIIYSLEELNKLVDLYHSKGKKIGAHIAGKKAIDMALESDLDIIHHAHGINRDQIKRVKDQGEMIVATPLGGTHLRPNSPEEIALIVSEDIPLAISTDSYLPAFPGVYWLPFNDTKERGPESLMLISNPSMKLLSCAGLDENDILKLITLNAAKVLGKDHLYGSLEKGKYANFIVSTRVPGLEITDPSEIKSVYFKGNKVIDKK